QKAPERAALAQLYAAPPRLGDESRDRLPAFDKAAFPIVRAVSVERCVPGGKSRPHRCGVQQLRSMAAPRDDLEAVLLERAGSERRPPQQQQSRLVVERSEI